MIAAGFVLGTLGLCYFGKGGEKDWIKPKDIK